MRSRRILMCGCLMLASAHGASAQIALRALALSGQHAPDTSAEVIFGPQPFWISSMGAGGEVAFQAWLTTRQGLYVPDVIYLGTPDNLHIVARQGDVAPGAGGQPFSPVGMISVGPAGNAAFDAVLPYPTSGPVSEGIWLGRPGSLTKVAVSGEHAPGTPDGVMWGRTDEIAPFGLPFQTGIDRVLFQCDLRGEGINSSNDSGCWAGRPGDLALVARLGDSAPGTNAVFSRLSRPTMNNLGNVAFSAELSSPGVNGVTKQAIYVGMPGNMNLLARDGDPAPVTGPARTFAMMESVVPQNDAGECAFHAYLSGAANVPGDAAIFAGKPGHLRTVVRVGTAAPGLSDGSVITSLSGIAPLINHGGSVAFAAKVGDPARGGTWRTALYLSDNDQLALVALAGEPAPGAPPGATLSQFNNVMLNASGDLLIANLLGGTGAGAGNLGVFTWRKGQGLTPVAVPGQAVEVAPGDMRILENLTINSFYCSGMEDGQPNVFNDAGNFVMVASFTDHSQAILYGTVPEPGTLGLAALSTLLLTRRRRGERTAATEAMAKG